MDSNLESANFKKGYITTFGPQYNSSGSPYTSNFPGEISGITVTSFSTTATCSYLKTGGSYTTGGKKYTSLHDHGFKLGKGAQLTFVLGSNVKARDVYAIGWNDSGITLDVNSSGAQDIPQESTISGDIACDTKEVTYTKYHYDFDATNTVVIALNTNKRAIIGDIVFRLAMTTVLVASKS